jgi:uncharacterized protein (TIGR03083 family)
MMNPILEAFRDEGAALADALHELQPNDFERPTNCPPWNLAELVIHIAGSIRTNDFRTAQADAPREIADYYRRPERDTSEYRDQNVQRTKEATGRVLARMTATECYDNALRNTLATVETTDLGQIIEVPGVGPMRLDGWLATRLVALAAHGVDVAITLETKPWTTPAASTIMRPIFESLLTQAVPPELEWSDQQLLEAATGRAPLTAKETTLLGQLAERFPLLS